MGVAAGTARRFTGLSVHLHSSSYDSKNNVRDAFTLAPVALGSPLAWDASGPSRRKKEILRSGSTPGSNIAKDIIKGLRQAPNSNPLSRPILQIWLSTNISPTIYLDSIDCDDRRNPELRLENILDEVLAVSKFVALTAGCGEETEGKTKIILRFDQTIVRLADEVDLAEDNIPENYHLAVFNGLGSLGTRIKKTINRRWSSLTTTVHGDIVAMTQEGSEPLEVVEQLMSIAHGETPGDLGYIAGTLSGPEVQLILIPVNELSQQEDSVSVLVDSFTESGEDLAMNVKRSGMPDGHLTHYANLRTLAKVIISSVKGTVYNSSEENIIAITRPYWILRVTALIAGLSGTELVTLAEHTPDILEMLADTTLARMWYDLRDGLMLSQHKRLEELSFSLHLVLVLTETINETVQVAARISPNFLITILRCLRDEYLSPYFVVSLSGNSLLNVLMDLLTLSNRAGKTPNNSEACKVAGMSAACIAMFLTSVAVNDECRLVASLADFFTRCNEYLEKIHNIPRINLVDNSNLRNSLIIAATKLWEVAASYVKPASSDTAQIHALAAQCCVGLNTDSSDRWTKHLLENIIDTSEGPVEDIVDVARGKQRLRRALTLCQLTTYKVAFKINEAFASHLFGQPNAIKELWSESSSRIARNSSDLVIIRKDESTLNALLSVANPLRLFDRPMCAPRIEFLNLVELTENNYQVQNEIPLDHFDIADRGSDREQYISVPCTDNNEYSVNDLGCLMEWFIRNSLDNLEGIRWELNIMPKVDLGEALVEATSPLEENNFMSVLEEGLVHATSRHLICSVRVAGRKSAAQIWDKLCC